MCDPPPAVRPLGHHGESRAVLKVSAPLHPEHPGSLSTHQSEGRGHRLELFQLDNELIDALSNGVFIGLTTEKERQPWGQTLWAPTPTFPCPFLMEITLGGSKKHDICG